MNLWQRTDMLEIRQESREDYSNLTNYPLYGAGFTTGLKFIFQKMEEERNVFNHEVGRGWMMQKDDSNVLAFIGERGAGKTTAMKEFCRILENLSVSDDFRSKWLEKLYGPGESTDIFRYDGIKFHVLKLIDAGLLNESEDLLEQILVNLYDEYNESIEKKNVAYSSKYQSTMLEIEANFQELLEMYNSTRKKDFYAEDYTLSSISRLTGSSAFMREKIANLLTQLCEIQRMQDTGLSGGLHEYFVVAIDDLDLNLKHGYEMLEQLQKYFSDSRMLILITMDYEQLCDVCMEHFHRAMPFTDELGTSGIMHRSQILATDTMTKVFPLNQRIFLPDAKKLGRQIRISMSKDGEEIPVKKYIMEKVAASMRIYYDAEGMKRHFCEPDTIRQFVFYNDFLNSLNQVNFDGMHIWNEIERCNDTAEKERLSEFNRRQLNAYDQNHYRFNDDIAKRQAQVMLTISKRQAFKTLLGFDLTRRPLYFVKACPKIENGTRKIEFVDVLVEKRKDYRYSDLIERIYTWGRNHYEDKPFISCVLASFTSEMVREYINYRYQPDLKSRNISKERLMGFLGKSFSNTWMVTGKKTTDNTDSKESQKASMRTFGYAKKVKMDKVSLWFDLSIINKIKDNVPSGFNLKVVRKKCLEDWMRDEMVVPILECLDMFLIVEEGLDYNGPKMEFKTEFPINSKVEIPTENNCVKVSFLSECIFDIMGFIPKSGSSGNFGRKTP